MNKIALIATAASLAAIPAFAGAETTQPVQAAADEVTTTVEINRGKMLYGAGGKRIAKVYSIDADGNPQVILRGRMITVPAATLSEQDGKVMTSLSRREVSSTR